MADITSFMPANYILEAVDNSGPNNLPLYLGFAIPGTPQASPGWVLVKLVYDANGKVAQPSLFANLSAAAIPTPDPKLIYNNRAGYTYS